MSDKDIQIQDDLPTPPQMSYEKKLEMLKQAVETTDDPNLIKKLEAEIADLYFRHLDD